MDEQLTRDDIKQALRETLDDYLGTPHTRLGGKWHGGTMVLQPENESLKPKTIEIEAFFHKIVMLRESLRVLEQKINNHPKLDDEDRVGLQQYISRIYGTLTTFNVFFADDEDKFVGQKT